MLHGFRQTIGSVRRALKPVLAFFQPAEAQPAAFFTVRLDPRVVFEFPLELFHRLT